MAITRRQFLARTSAAAAGSFLAPSFFRNPWLQQALADTIGDRYFISLYLGGGNDGLNTIVPYDDVGGLRTAYEVARNTGPGGLRMAPGALAVPSASFLDPNTGTQLGFHPGLAALSRLYDQGKVAVFQGCGYPDYNLSHAVSTDIWETAAPGGSSGTGWLGRYLAANYGSSDIPAVNVNRSIAGEFIQSATSVLAIRRLRRFGFPYDNWNRSDETAKRNAFLNLHAAAASSAHAKLSFLGNSGQSTLISTESYPQVHDLYEADRESWSDQYDDLGTSTSRDLREIAKIIYGVANGTPNVEARFFELSNGGYDTHSDQGGADSDGRHFSLHAEVGDALELFYNDIADMQPGLENKIAIMVWSEFSRRIPQNDNGTDHGSQGPMFVIGGGVNGGVYGNHPNIDEDALDRRGNTVYSQAAGDGFRSTDFRDVYGTILKHWLNMPEAQILSGILPPDSGDPNLYWTAPSFDMGFL